MTRQRSDGGEARQQAPGIDDGAEAAAHALLRLVADHPGQSGRVRAARVIGGFTVPYRDEDEAQRLRPYAVQLSWTIRETTQLVDAMLRGGLMVQTPGPRPVLVLTRAGFRALDALEGIAAASMSGLDELPSPAMGTPS